MQNKKKTVLYIGLTPPSPTSDANLIHHPLISIVPKNFKEPLFRQAIETINSFTHLIFTSKNGVACFIEVLKFYNYPLHTIQRKKIIAVGKKTANFLESHSLSVDLIAKKEQAEGIIELFEEIDLKDATILWPHSSKARNVISNYLTSKNIPFFALPLYDTITKRPKEKIDLQKIDEIIFTSPSTVDAFLQVYGPPPPHILCSSIGAITSSYLSKFTDGYHFLFRTLQ